MRYAATALTVAVLLLPLAAAMGGEHGENEYLIVPKDYTPEKAWPLIIVCQNQVSQKAVEGMPYFVAYGGPDRAAILEVARKYNIDPFRIYGTGFSRSGHGMLEYSWSYPHTYAAIAPVCEDMREKEQYGKRQRIDLLKYITTPTYLWHGDHDSFLVSGKKNYELMKAAGCPVQFGTFPGGHGPDPIYYNDMRKLTDFFEKHVLDPFPKEVSHVVYAYAATRAFWVDARVAKGSIETEYPFFKLKVNGNGIEVLQATEGVKKLDFYLTDKLLDMGKPVTVSFEGKEVFKGPAAPKVTVTLREGDVNPTAGETPLWEAIQAGIYTRPSPAGGMDWMSLDMHTAFPDTRLDRPVTRRITLDVGLRAADGPAEAVIKPESRKFVALKLAEAGPAPAPFDFAALAKKLPAEVTMAVKTFGLTGSVETPAGADPIKLVPPDQAKTGQVVLVKVKIANKGSKDLVGVAQLTRSPFLTYPIGLWPAEDKGDFVKGIYEVAGTKGIQWQYFFSGHNNWPYQVLGYFMLNPGGLPKVTALSQAVYRSPLWAAQRELTIKAGQAVENPLLLISVPSPDAKAEKPKVPDLPGIIEQIKPELVKAL